MLAALGVASEAEAEGAEGVAVDGVQRTASATTIPSAWSDSRTPWSAPGLKANVPSDCQPPPLVRWSTLTDVDPAACVTTYVALLARFGPLVQRADTSYVPATADAGSGQVTVPEPSPADR